MTEEENKTIEQELEQLKQTHTSLTGELGVRNQRIAELEQTLTSRDTEAAALKQNMADLQNQLHSVRGVLTQAVIGYRTMTVKANQDIPAELITGDTIEAIDNTAAGAREIVGKVREKLVAAQAQFRVPAGAPPRTPPDLSGLSPREKIQQGIGKQR